LTTSKKPFFLSPSLLVFPSLFCSRSIYSKWPLKTAKGFGEYCKLPQWDMGRIHGPIAFSVYFRAKGTRLVTENVVLFLLNEMQKPKQMCLFLDSLW